MTMTAILLTSVLEPPTLLPAAKDHIFLTVPHLFLSNYIINNQLIWLLQISLDPWPLFWGLAPKFKYGIKLYGLTKYV